MGKSLYTYEDWLSDPHSSENEPTEMTINFLDQIWTQRTLHRDGELAKAELDKIEKCQSKAFGLIVNDQANEHKIAFEGLLREKLHDRFTLQLMLDDVTARLKEDANRRMQSEMATDLFPVLEYLTGPQYNLMLHDRIARDSYYHNELISRFPFNEYVEVAKLDVQRAILSEIINNPTAQDRSSQKQSNQGAHGKSQTILMADAFLEEAIEIFKDFKGKGKEEKLISKVDQSKPSVYFVHTMLKKKHSASRLADTDNDGQKSYSYSTVQRRLVESVDKWKK